MSLTSFIGDNTFWIGLVLMSGFVLWKFVLEPISNEDAPIEPKPEDIPTFGEKMQENLNTEVNF